MSIEHDRIVEKVNEQLSDLNRRAVLSNMQLAKKNALERLLRRYLDGEGEIMKRILCVVMMLVVVFAGCANVKISKAAPNGVKWTAEYTRWFNQKIDECELIVEPNGVAHFKIKGQLSESQIAFKLGQASVGVGGTK